MATFDTGEVKHQLSSGCPTLLEGSHISKSDLIGMVRQLVCSVTANLKISPTATNGIEEAMSQLEATDENFNSYELVRTLHNGVESAVGPLVKAKVEDRIKEAEDQEKVAEIADEVINSKEYSQMLQLFVSELRSAVDEMLAEEKIISTQYSEEQEHYLLSSRSSATHYYNLDESETSGISSFNQTGLMFMSHDQLQSITESLADYQPIEVRLEAMHHLLQFPPGDLVNCDNWTNLKDAVGSALMEEDTQLANLSLKFHYRMFMCHMTQTSLIVYMGLLDKLVTYFRSQEGGASVTISMGIDPADDRSIKLLARFRFLNYIQGELPSYWLRYSTGAVTDMIEATADLLSLSYSNTTMLSPVHYIALFDPKATWFRKWTHSQSSRSLVIEALKNHPIILQGIVLQVLKFNPIRSRSAKKLTNAMRHAQSISSSSSNAEMGYYNEKMLQYAHFIHSLGMLERLLLYKRGRDLFPVAIPGRNDALTITDLLLHLLDVMLVLSSLSPSPSRAQTSHLQLVSSELEDYNPISIIAHVFEEIITGNALGQQLFCNESLLSAMITPLERFLDPSSPVHKVNEEMLILLGDMLAVLASTDATRRLILKKSSMKKSSVVDTIVGFTILALSSISSAVQVVSPPVASAWLFVVRQLYKTGEGLSVLEFSDLHQHVARAWKTLKSSEISSKDAGMISRKFLHGETAYSLEDSLIDNLLDFAGTPKGILLLQQTGLMCQCTQYMYKRYRLKLQVSKCEKFGYGCMVTQLASTLAGMLQLIHCGFISMLVEELWGILEGGSHDYRITAPRLHPLDPLDRASHKAVINLLNVLSSFPALYEAVSKATPTSSSSTVSDIFDRLVLVDTVSKRNALLHFEEDHLFGLRILSMLITCLDSYLFLESKFHFTEALCSLQKDSENVGGDFNEGDFIILDACSMERNRILVICYFIGGPNERVLPPHHLSEVGEEYRWPLFTSYPAPSQYQPPLKKHTFLSKESSGGELYKFLLSSMASVEAGWMEKLRGTFKRELMRRKTLSCEVVKLLLVKYISVAVNTKDEVMFPQKQVSHGSGPFPRPPSHPRGIEMTIRYGRFLGLLDSSPNHTTNLINLLGKIHKMWAQEQRDKKKTDMDFLDRSYPGFDWFSSSIFLLMRGSVEESWKFAQSFSTLLTSAYLWFPRLHLSVHLPSNVVYAGVHPVNAVTLHLVELILQAEVPHVSSAFRMSGYTPSQICQHWIRQCFWNFLDWCEICNYITCCIVLGIEYQIYFCVSVLKHLEPAILRHTQEQDLIVFLKEDGLVGFHTADWLDFMDDLRERFGDTIHRTLTVEFFQ